MRAVTLPSKLTTYLPRDVFLCFSTFFATSTGLSSDVPEAAALSFCFLVAIAVSSSRASVSRMASCSASCCSCPESHRARAPLRQPAPRSLPRWAHSKCHHRFCGLAAWDGDVKQKSATGLKSHSAAHVLPRPTCGMLPAVENRPASWLGTGPRRFLRGASFGARHRNGSVTMCPHAWRSGLLPGTIGWRAGGP